MAIYHLTAKIVTRARGQSAVASAAYRSGGLLHDERIGQAFDYSHKRGVEHSEILAPASAPSWVHNRNRLWNSVEKAEKRKDAQLAREIEIALPVELGPLQQVELLRDYAQRTFVSQGMVVDMSVHRDNPENPHAHLMLTTRDIGPDAFGPKRRDWNTRESLLQWREAWSDIQNEHLVRAGIDLRVDHRSLEAQGLDLVPGRKIGIARERQVLPNLPRRIADRVEEQRRIAHENGELILAEPNIALKALTQRQATFTEHDLVKWLNTRTDGADQFRAAHLKLTTSPDLINLGKDDRGSTRYTSREMLDVERQLLQRAAELNARRKHEVSERRADAVLTQHGLSEEQTTAFQAVVTGGDLKALVGVAGSGKSRMLSAAREAWEAEGYTVKGAALSGIAAENLSLASGIDSRTIASLEYAWRADRDRLTSKDILVIDEAGMIGTRQLARVLEAAASARAKVVLVGDPEQLQAIEAGAAFRGVLAESESVELTEVRRQSQSWQREATHQLASGKTTDALTLYEEHGAILQSETRDGARSALLARWAQDGQANLHESRLMLAYTRKDVAELNELARNWRRDQGELGRSETIETEKGTKEIAVGERLYFLRNERSLGVKNGSLGTVEHIRNGVLQVKLDSSGDQIVVDTRFYRDLDYGYAATVYKAQGTTVDRTYALATSHYDRHSAYVALSRHRTEATMFYAPEDFQPPWAVADITPSEARQRLLDVLSRARPKELAHDYLDRSADNAEAPNAGRTMESIDALQQRAVDRWREMNRPNRSAEHDRQRERSHTNTRSHANDGHEVDL